MFTISFTITSLINKIYKVLEREYTGRLACIVVGDFLEEY